MITTNIIKTVHINILAPLKHIVNLIFETGTIPLQFKQSRRYTNPKTKKK